MNKLFIVAASALLLVACGKEEAKPPVPRLVKVVVVGESLQSFGVSDAGAMTAPSAAGLVDRDPAALSFDAPGRLMALLVSAGEQVSAGQALARLDPSDLALSESSARVQLSAAQAELGAAEADLKRYAELYEKGFISLAEYDRRRAQMVSARARFEALVDQLGYLTLRAVEPGRVSAVTVKEGTAVNARQVVIRIALTSVATSAATSTSGRTSANTSANTSSGTSPRRGAAPASVLRLPLAALMGDSTVYRLKPQGDGTALIEKVSVKIGRVSEEAAEILSGLNRGDLVVGAGVHVLSEGERVRLPADGARPL